jgi:tRNA threonylcarbamoyladenosine biosynthesis protein TsaB
MALLLNIDTATETGSIALSDGDTIIDTMINEDQKDHAGWIHNAINELMKNAGRKLNQLEAIAVTAGPGSYTGLRVGMATAKGLCYVLKIPLITENTLKVMARAGIEHTGTGEKLWYCPMIDARRMEVFTAVYDGQLNEILKPQPMVLDEGSFAALLSQNHILFFGSGSIKFKNIVQNAQASFADIRYTANHLAYLAQTSFSGNNFTDPAYAEPAYLKEFYTHTKK